jgi:Thioesterase domain
VRFLAIAVSVVVGLTACGGPPSASSTPSNSVPSISTAGVPASSAAPIRGLYDTGNGRQLWISCTGTGSPTVILVDGANWPSEIRDPLAVETRTCVYDGAGSERSAGTPQPDTMGGVVADLAGLLAAAHVPGPYLLVGWSIGGQIVLHFALTHGSDTAGLVVIDTGFPSTDTTHDPLRILLTDDEWAKFLIDDAWAQATLAETEALIHPLPGIPIRLLTATRPDIDCWEGKDEAFCARLAELSAKSEAGWLTLSPTATQVLVDTGHSVPFEAPGEVLAQVKIAIEKIRAAT